MQMLACLTMGAVSACLTTLPAPPLGSAHKAFEASQDELRRPALAAGPGGPLPALARRRGPRVCAGLTCGDGGIVKVTCACRWRAGVGLRQHDGHYRAPQIASPDRCGPCLLPLPFPPHVNFAHRRRFSRRREECAVARRFGSEWAGGRLHGTTPDSRRCRAAARRPRV